MCAKSTSYRQCIKYLKNLVTTTANQNMMRIEQLDFFLVRFDFKVNVLTSVVVILSIG